MIQSPCIVRRLLKWGGIAIGSLVLLALVRFGILYAVNLRDEPVSLEAQALLVPPMNPYRAEENLYLAMEGSDAASGQSPIRAAQERIDYYDRNLERALAAPPGKYLEILRFKDQQRLAFKGDLDFTFSRSFHSYWNDIPPHRQEVERLLGVDRELYERYQDLHQLKGYFETARASFLAPSFPGLKLSEVQALFMAAAVLKMRSEDPKRRQEGLADLENDVRLWRAVLVGDGSLTSKWVALIYLEGDEGVLADVIADAHASLPLSAAQADAIAPLFALTAWDVGSAYRAEFRAEETLLQRWRTQREPPWLEPERGRMRRWLDRIGGNFFKVNATENLFAAYTLRMVRAAAPGTVPEIQVSASWMLRSLYNPVGKMLLAVIPHPLDRDFPARAWDGAAVQRLLRLSYEIRRQRIGPAGIPAFLEAHPEWSTHPGNRRPFLWDEKAGTLRVQTRAQGSFFVHVWREPSGE